MKHTNFYMEHHPRGIWPLQIPTCQLPSLNLTCQNTWPLILCWGGIHSCMFHGAIGHVGARLKFRIDFFLSGINITQIFHKYQERGNQILLKLQFWDVGYNTSLMYSHLLPVRLDLCPYRFWSMKYLTFNDNFRIAWKKWMWLYASSRSMTKAVFKLLKAWYWTSKRTTSEFHLNLLLLEQSKVLFFS